MILGRVAIESYIKLPIASRYGTLRMHAASCCVEGELSFEYDAEGVIGMSYGLASFRVKRAMMELMYDCWGNEIVPVVKSLVILMPSSQLTGLRSVRG